MPSFDDRPSDEVIRRPDGTLAVATLLADQSIHYRQATSFELERFRNIPGSVLSAIRFPSAICVPPSASEIIKLAEDELTGVADFAGKGARCFAHFLLATWFAEQFPTPLTVVLVAPDPSTAGTLLTVSTLLSRRSLCVGHRSVPKAAFWASAVGGTLVVDAYSAAESDVRAFLPLNLRGELHVADGELRCCACPRIIIASEPLAIPEAVHLPIIPGRICASIDEPSRARIVEIAAAFAGYRLKHLSSFQEPACPLAADANGTLFAESVVGSCIFDDAYLQQQLHPLLVHQFGKFPDLAARDPKAALAQVLFALAHKKSSGISVAEITDAVGLLADVRGDSETGKRISVGRLLSNFGIERQHRNLRNVVPLNQPNLSMIHKVAWDLGAIKEDNLIAGCVSCNWLVGGEGLEGFSPKIKDEGGIS